MRLPQFTIRDLLWLMVVAGLGLALLAEHWQLAATVQDLRDSNKGKEAAETGWQHSVVEHNKTLRLLEESGLGTVTDSGGKTRLQKIERSPNPQMSGTD
jgi:hypothetical protein